MGPRGLSVPFPSPSASLPLHSACVLTPSATNAKRGQLRESAEVLTQSGQEGTGRRVNAVPLEQKPREDA